MKERRENVMKQKKQLYKGNVLFKTIIAGILAVVLLLVILFVQVDKTNQMIRQREEMDSINRQEMISGIHEVSEHLSEVEQSILGNQKALYTLEHASNYHEDVTNQYKKVEETISTLEKLVQSFQTNYVSNNKEMEKDLILLSEEVKNIQEDIRFSYEETVIFLKINKIIEEWNQNKTDGKLEENKSYLEHIKKEMEENKESLEKRYEFLLNILAEMEKKQEKNQSEKQEEILKAMSDVKSVLSEELQKEMNALYQIFDHQYLEIEIQMEKDILLLSEKLNTLYKQAIQTRTELSVLLEVLNSKQDIRQEEIKESFIKIGQMGEQIHSDFIENHEELKQWISELERSQSEQQKELLSILKTMETDMTDNIFQHLNIMQGSLSSMEETYLIYLEELKSEMGERFLNIDTAIHDQFFNQTVEFNSQFKELNKETGEQLMNLDTLIENNHMQLYNTMKSNDENIKQYLGDRFLSIDTSVRQKLTEQNIELTNVMNELHTSTQSQIYDLNSLITGHHMELGSVIENGNEELKEYIGEKFSSMDTSIRDQLHTQSEERSQQVDELHKEMDNQFTAQEFAMKNRHTELGNILGRNEEELKSYLESAFLNMNQRMDSVFQSVSSGKRLLASALLTKGVNCKEDATFREIENAILKIPQKLVIGQEQIPGNITYDYHYHTDGKGKNPHTEKVSVSQKGGCYVTPIYHSHTGDHKNGGGCYSIPINHTHGDSCYTVTKTVREVKSYWFTGQGSGHSCCSPSHGQNYAKYTYEEKIYVDGVLVSSTSGEKDLGYCCNLCLAPKALANAKQSTESTIICGYSEGLNGYNLGCGMTTGTVIAYASGCGLSDGQITGAHIQYQSTVKTSSAFYQEDINTLTEMENTEEIKAKANIERIITVSDNDVSGNQLVQ